ncbi:Recombination protein O N terminal [Streptomyces sp. 3213]|nr:Recombination protein O N terminal [Streptomyces sp. 3213] [Streptomyces sp. 3213.3]
MGPMSLFRDDGIVLRTQKLGEADRIVPQSPGGRPPYPRQKSRGGAR